MKYQFKAIITTIVIEIIIYLLWVFINFDFYYPIELTFLSLQGRAWFVIVTTIILTYSFMAWSYREEHGHF